MKIDNKKLTIGAAALTAIIISVGMVASSFAYQGDPNVQGPNYSPERHEAMTKAFEAKDYNAWKEARGEMGHGKMMDVVNADNFDLFAEMHKARLAGDTKKAEEIRNELGLGEGCGKMMRGQGHGEGCGEMMGHGRHEGDHEKGFEDANGDGVCDHMQEDK